MIIAEAMGMGVPAGTAKAIGGSCASAVAAAGNSLATSTVLAAANNLVASGSGGVVLPPNSQSPDCICVANITGGSINVYPPTSSGKINGGSAGAAISVSNTKGACLVCLDGVNWLAIYN